MSTNARPDQNGSDTTSLIGIDAEGSEHRYIHHRDTVRVQRPDESVDHYGAESVDAWVDIVADQLGWAVCHARMDDAELVAHGFRSDSA